MSPDERTRSAASSPGLQRRRGTRVARAAILAGALLACDPGSAGNDRVRPDARRYAAQRWDTLWTRRHGVHDTLIEYPVRIGAFGPYVFVVDAAARRLVALHADDGRLAWTRSTSGDGAPLFGEVSAMTVDLHGTIFIADSRAGVLAIVDSSGRSARRVRIDHLPFVLAMCALRDETLILHTLQTPPLVQYHVGRRFAAAIQFPWPDAYETPPLALQGMLSRSTDGDGCVDALGLGRGFAIVRPNGAERPHPYVELLELPRISTSSSTRGTSRIERAKVTRRQLAAVALSVAGGEITIPFVGETRPGWQIVDLYSERTGGYLRSLSYPHRVTDLTRRGDVFYSVDGPNGAVLAVRLGETP